MPQDKQPLKKPIHHKQPMAISRGKLSMDVTPKTQNLLYLGFKGCVHYIFASWKNVFYFTSKALSTLKKIKFLNFRYIFKFHDIIKGFSIKQETHFVE